MKTAIKAVDLRRVLAATLPWTAAPGDDAGSIWPDTSVLHVDSAGGALTVTGTDRYCLAHARADVAGPGWSGTKPFAVDAARRVVDLIDRATWISDVIVHVDDRGRLVIESVEGGGWIEHGPSDAESSHCRLNAPAVRYWFHPAKPVAPREAELAIRAEVWMVLGESIRALTQSGEPLWTRVTDYGGEPSLTRPAPPVKIEVGDSFAVLICPARYSPGVWKDGPVPYGPPATEPKVGDMVRTREHGDASFEVVGVRSYEGGTVCELRPYFAAISWGSILVGADLLLTRAEEAEQ